MQPTHWGGDIHIRPGGLGVQPGAPYSLTRGTKASLVRVSHLGPIWMRVHGHARIPIHARMQILMGSIVRVHVGLGLLCRGVGVHGGLVGVKVIMHGGVLGMGSLRVLECMSMMSQALQEVISVIIIIKWRIIIANCITQGPKLQYLTGKMLDLHGWGTGGGSCQMDSHDHHCRGLVWAGAGRPPAALQMPVCHLLQWSVNSTHPVRHPFTLFAATLAFHCRSSQLHL